METPLSSGSSSVTMVAESVGGARIGQRLSGLRFKQWQPYLYLLPALLTILIWIYRPLVETFQLSFYQWNLIPTTPRVYVGLDNYQRILSLPEVSRALNNTLIYIVGLLPLSVLLPLVVAIVTDNMNKRWRNIYRALIFMPIIMAPVVVAFIWRWLLHPSEGLFNAVWTSVGGEAVNFFRDRTLALWTIIFITGWKLVGFSTLIFSAALSNIPREYLEAASIDGATQWQLTRFIRLPLLSSTILLMFMLSVLLSSAWTFAYINVLTQGGPRGATTNIYYLLWEYGFGTFAIGWGSAAAVLLFIGFGVLAAVLLQLVNRFSFYDN